MRKRCGEGWLQVGGRGVLRGDRAASDTGGDIGARVGGDQRPHHGSTSVSVVAHSSVTGDAHQLDDARGGSHVFWIGSSRQVRRFRHFVFYIIIPIISQYILLSLSLFITNTTP